MNILEASQILDWPSVAAIPYARIRHRNRKQPIGDRDYMIAAHAIALDAILVTNNTKHLSVLATFSVTRTGSNSGTIQGRE